MAGGSDGGFPAATRHSGARVCSSGGEVRRLLCVPCTRPARGLPPISHTGSAACSTGHEERISQV